MIFSETVRATPPLHIGTAARPTQPTRVADEAELAGRLGQEIAGPLSSALERLLALAGTGTIDRVELNALREDIERARRVGIMGQQFGRFAAGQVRQVPERLDLALTLRDALRQRERETGARGIEIRQQLQPVHISADAPLVFSLLQTLLDWAFEHSRSRVDFRIDLQSWPVQAQLSCVFAHRGVDEIDTTARAEFEQVHEQQQHGPGPLDTVSWALLQQIATTLGLQVERDTSAWQVTVGIVFPAALTNGELTLAEIDAEADDDEDDTAPHSRPPVGSHVLVVAGRRELRNAVRESLRRFAVMIDFAASIDEAHEFCRHGLPHAIVYDAALAGAEPLRRSLQLDMPTLAFIRLSDESDSLEVSRSGGRETTTVGRDAIMRSLPAALTYELARWN